ncbi:Cytochrome P450 3A28 [Coccomyxa sp. Obi]|nr:Cytochrome P450 3A28 [Coccomyxa sp. Obi]
MADIDFASLAQEQPYVVAAGLGFIGIVLFLLLGRKSYGPVPKHLKSFDRIPGPVGLPVIGNLLSFHTAKPKAHLTWAEWAKTYGKIYKYSLSGKRFVVVTDPAALPTVLGSENFSKSPLATAGEGALSKEAHAGLASAFGPEGAKAQFGTALRRAVDLAAKIDKDGPDMPIDMQAALEDAVLDTVLTNAFDATAEKLDAVRKPLQASLHAASIQAARPVTNPMGALFGGSATRDAKADAAWIELVRGLRRRGPAAKTDASIAAALSRLTDADGAPLSDEALATQAAALTAAALEPTALSIAWALFSIATTPSLQDGIAKELSENGLLAHGEDREPRLPEYDDLPKLPYLTAVIKESQRLFPAAAIGPLRYADKNTELAGYFIPKGTHIQVPLLALHTAPWNWPQPERFWPERWTTPEARGGPKAGTDGLASAFLPCGASCISAHVAEAQVAAFVAVLASRFKMSLSGGGRKAALERQTLDSTLRLAGGMKMVFVPRASIGFSSRL